MEDPKQEILLVAADGSEFVVDADAAHASAVLSSMFGDVDCDDRARVPLDVQGRSLERIVRYMKTRDAAAVIPTEKDELLELVVAANYLNIEPLLDAACGAVAERIKDKSPEEIREAFGLENTFSPEEEAEIRRQNAWAFQ